MATKGKGMKGWWKRCVRSVSRELHVVDPEAICGAALRQKRAKGYKPAKRSKAR